MTICIWGPRARKTTGLVSTIHVPRTDRRGTPRQPCRLSCSCSTVSLNPQAASVAAQLRDVSPGGIGLVLGQPVLPGTFLAIKVWGRPRAPVIRARVVRTALQRSTGHWVIGCVLAPPLCPAELKALA